MNENIFWILATKIKDGEMENLKVLMNEMVEATKTNEPDAVSYEWYISADEKYCHLYENYKDSSATIIHMNEFAKKYAKKFMSILEIKNFTVYGKPSDELKSMLDPLGVIYMLPFGGFTR